MDSRDAIAKAYLSLADTVPINKISIGDITEIAGVSRRAFYNHFADKYDLSIWIFRQSIQEKCDKTLGSNGTYWDFQRTCIDGYLERANYTRNQVRNTHGPDSWREAASSVLVDILSENIATRFGEAAVSSRVRFHLLFFLRASIWAIIEWESQGMLSDARTPAAAPQQ